MTFYKSLVLLLFKERDTENLVAVKIKYFVFVTYLKIIICMLFESLMNSYSYCFTAELPDECIIYYVTFQCIATPTCRDDIATN